MSLRIRCISVLMILLLSVLFSHAAEAPAIIDNSGDAILLQNITGCHNNQSGYTITCPDHHRIAPVEYVFFVKDLSSYTTLECDKCISGTCSKSCCFYNDTDCRVDNHPYKELLQKLDYCSHRTKCDRQPFAWIRVQSNDPCPSGFTGLYSQRAQLNYYCIDDQWETQLDRGNSNTGKALFLTSSKSLHNETYGFNLSCTATASDQQSTIEIRALDFRLCIDLTDANRNFANTKSCGQVFHVMENGSDVSGFPIEVTRNNDEGFLGLKHFYTSSSSEVTLKLDSVKLDDTAHTFSIWLYFRPTQGDVTIKCENPKFVTTTSTTTTTTTMTTTTSSNFKGTNFSESVTSEPSPATSTTTTTKMMPSTTKSLSTTTSAPVTDVNRNGGSERRQDSADNEDDLTKDILMYERIAVTGLVAVLLLVLFIFVFACYRWRVKQVRYKKGMQWKDHLPDKRADGMLLQESQNDYVDTPHRNPVFVQHDEQHYAIPRRERHAPAQGNWELLHKTTHPRPTTHKEERRPPPARRQNAPSKVQTPNSRAKLLELVAKQVRNDPDMEASLRELAGPQGSDLDIRVILGQLTTSALRQAYEEMQDM